MEFKKARGAEKAVNARGTRMERERALSLPADGERQDATSEGWIHTCEEKMLKASAAAQSLHTAGILSRRLAPLLPASAPWDDVRTACRDEREWRVW